MPPGARVLDVGCADAVLFQVLGARITFGLGIDPDIEPLDGPGYRLVRGHFPEDVTEEVDFDTITILAVLEHIPENAQGAFARACFERLRPGGKVVVTVPHPAVDRIIDVLQRLRLLDGMAEEQHYGFQPAHAISEFSRQGFTVLTQRRFQLGLNNLFVFERPGSALGGPSRTTAAAR